eukprot:TRINITY_DN17408_c0_g1_i1.p1 TRINITY_DN17408_c0_g1~~TRINITY_DN17408_c0_g1_i1.p1  ORF type:complete len:810 (+),score=161.34 TRINITY_DN17408_c0_g1_i1:252-2681(+)
MFEGDMSKPRKGNTRSKRPAAKQGFTVKRKRRFIEVSFFLAPWVILFLLILLTGRSASFQDLSVKGGAQNSSNCTLDNESRKNLAIQPIETATATSFREDGWLHGAPYCLASAIVDIVISQVSVNVCAEKSIASQKTLLEEGGLYRENSSINESEWIQDSDTKKSQNEDSSAAEFVHLLENTPNRETCKYGFSNGVEFPDGNCSVNHFNLGQTQHNNNIELSLESEASLVSKQTSVSERDHLNSFSICPLQSHSESQISSVQKHMETMSPLSQVFTTPFLIACVENQYVKDGISSHRIPFEAKQTLSGLGDSPVTQCDDQQTDKVGLVSDKSSGEKKIQDTTATSLHKPSADKDFHQQMVRSSRVTPLGLGEYKKKANNEKERSSSHQSGSVRHLREHGGIEYNYASASKGAKILACNKETKSPENILVKDKDKYLRNPCSAEDKFVVIELAEETLVDTIAIANFEYYSSNLKEFELLGSLVYPTNNWTFLGRFIAENAKNMQRFALEEAKWARYIKLKLLSHYGSEFFCTLSVVEVYGVDAVEQMLKDMISDEGNSVKKYSSGENVSSLAGMVDIPSKGVSGAWNNSVALPAKEKLQDKQKQASLEAVASAQEQDTSKGSSPTMTKEILQHGGRLPGDTIMKILLQKVRSLEMNLSLLEQYLEELNLRYADLFSEFDKELESSKSYLDKIKMHLSDLHAYNKRMEEETEDYRSWRTSLSRTIIELARKNDFLSSEIKNNHSRLQHLENKESLVLFVSLIFGCIAMLRLAVDLFVTFFRLFTLEKIYKHTSAWVILLLCSSFIAFIVSL